MNLEPFSDFGVRVWVDRIPYVAVFSEDRTRWKLVLVRQQICTGSILVDERGSKYRVDQVIQTNDGFAELRVTFIS